MQVSGPGGHGSRMQLPGSAGRPQRSRRPHHPGPRHQDRGRQPGPGAGPGHFANSHFFALPAGHGLVFTECGLDLMTQFLADPTQEPDASCIAAMTANWVLPE